MPESNRLIILKDIYESKFLSNHKAKHDIFAFFKRLFIDKMLGTLKSTLNQNNKNNLHM